MLGLAEKTHIFLCPRFNWSLDTLLGIDPPILSHVRKMSEAEIVKMHQEPLRFFFGILRLIRLK